MLKSILTKLDSSHPNYELAKKEATNGRWLLSVKRSGVYKCRGVKQGFREVLEEADGPGFMYNSHVARFSSVRMALMRPKRGNRAIAIQDVSEYCLFAVRTIPRGCGQVPENEAPRNEGG